MQNITIIIPTHGRNSLLERTLNSLEQCEFPDNYKKTIVIENGPKEKAEEICAKFVAINCEYQYSASANKSAALNTAIATLKKDTFIIFFDDDIRLHPQTIQAYAASFEKHGENYFYGGPFEVDYERVPKSFYTQYLPFSALGWSLSNEQELNCYSFIGFNWAVSINHIRQLNGFDISFGPNSTTGATGQEHDMMFRLNEEGILPKYVEKAIVWHYVPKVRSSFRWALNRRYKGGVREGYKNSKWNEELIRKSVKENFIALLKCIIDFNKQKVMDQIFFINYLFGVKKGLKAKRKKLEISKLF